MIYSPCKGDIIEVPISSLKREYKQYVGRYLKVRENESKLSITECQDEAIAIIEEHLLKFFTWKEVWDLFKSKLLRIPKANSVRIKMLKAL